MSYNLIPIPDNFQEIKLDDTKQSIIDYFDYIAKQNPNKIAVRTSIKKVTYKELSKLITSRAELIVSKFGDGNDRLAIMLNDELDIIISIMATLKAGKAYVPLDAEDPEQRLIKYLSTAEVCGILVDSATLKLAEKISNSTIQLCHIKTKPISRSNYDYKFDSKPESIAYILFTSGTTGEPKGVLQNHTNILMYIRIFVNNIRMTSNDNICLFSSFCYIPSVYDILGALLTGATLFPRILKKTGLAHLDTWIINNKITVLHAKPTVYRAIVNNIKIDTKFEKVRVIILGGEKVRVEDINSYKKIFPDKCFFVNTMGATEIAFSLMYFLDKKTICNNQVPLGYPVDGLEVFLINDLSNDNKIQKGEMTVKSSFISLGYFNNELLTKEKFIFDKNNKNIRTYITGDIVKRLSDGLYLYEGRKDRQVKIRGHRVECSEIETRLMEIDNIKDVVVAAKINKNKETTLVAYVILNEKRKIDYSKYRLFLKRYFQNFMIPGVFEEVDSFPILANGKIDINSLHHKTLFFQKNEKYQENFDTIENNISKIWENILEIESLSTDSDFFELGGNSLQYVKLILDIEKQYKIEIPDNFLNGNNFSTITLISKYLKSQI